MGGTPLNNEVWYIDHVQMKTDRPAPLTRAMYVVKPCEMCPAVQERVCISSRML